MKTACPRCGANVTFAPGTQKLFCEYCNSQIDAKEFEKVEETVKINYDEYICSTCGAKLLADENTAITDCVYCGSRQIIKEKFNGEFEPKEIIPFKIDRNEFINIYTKHIKKKFWAPEAFKKKERLMQTKGVYVPYDLFIHDVDIYAKGDSRWICKGKNSSTTFIKNFEREFEIRTLTAVDACKRLNDDYMSSVEPFNFLQLEKFNPALLNGFLVETPNEDIEELERKSEARVMSESIRIINATLEEKEPLVKKEFKFKRGFLHANFKKIERRSVLLPIWFVNTKYKNKDYNYIVNGQTGEIVGGVPISKLKTTMLILGFIFATVAFLLFSYVGNVSYDNNDNKIDISSPEVFGTGNLALIVMSILLVLITVLPLIIFYGYAGFKLARKKLEKTEIQYVGVKRTLDNPIKVWNYKLKKAKVGATATKLFSTSDDEIVNIKKSVFRNGKPMREQKNKIETEENK